MTAEPVEGVASQGAVFPTGVRPAGGPDVIVAYRINMVGGYVTLQQASEFFGVQRERLQMACSRGLLPGRKVQNTFGRPPKDPDRERGMWLVHVNDVARYLATGRRGRPLGSKNQEADATRRRRSRELEKGRLAGSAARAALRSVASRQLVEARNQELLDAGVSYTERRRQTDVTSLSAHWDDTKVRNRTRLMAELERQEAAEAQAAAQRAAWEVEHGGAAEELDELEELEELDPAPPVAPIPPVPAVDPATLSPEAAAAAARRRARAAM